MKRRYAVVSAVLLTLLGAVRPAAGATRAGFGFDLARQSLSGVESFAWPRLDLPILRVPICIRDRNRVELEVAYRWVKAERGRKEDNLFFGAAFHRLFRAGPSRFLYVGPGLAYARTGGRSSAEAILPLTHWIGGVTLGLEQSLGRFVSISGEWQVMHSWGKRRFYFYGVEGNWNRGQARMRVLLFRAMLVVRFYFR